MDTHHFYHKQWQLHGYPSRFQTHHPDDVLRWASGWLLSLSGDLFGYESDG